jgi:hypothetical protein
MSQQNVKALRWLYGEWAKGNLWALRDIADPHIEWEWSPNLASLSGGPRIYRGLEEIGAATLEFLAAWDHYWMTAEEFIEAGEEIVVFMHVHARAASTDREHRLKHPNDPVLNRHVAAAVARDTPRGWRLEKAHRTASIDAVVALAMALERAEAKPEPVQLLGWL